MIQYLEISAGSKGAHKKYLDTAHETRYALYAYYYNLTNDNAVLPCLHLDLDQPERQPTEYPPHSRLSPELAITQQNAGQSAPQRCGQAQVSMNIHTNRCVLCKYTIRLPTQQVRITSNVSAGSTPSNWAEIYDNWATLQFEFHCCFSHGGLSRSSTWLKYCTDSLTCGAYEYSEVGGLFTQRWQVSLDSASCDALLSFEPIHGLSG